MRGPYNSNGYWKERGKTYLDEHRKRSLKSRLVFRIQEGHIAYLLGRIKADTILDVGCGYGRITKMIAENFQDAHEITGIDISEDQLMNAREFCAGYRVGFFEQSILERFKFDPRWDLVVAVEILMHITPNDIERAIENLTRVARRYILTCDWYEPVNPPESDFCFQHDYDKLFYLNGFRILKARRIHKQRIVLWERGQ